MKDSLRIILFRSLSKLAKIVDPIAAERVLRLVGIIEVDEFIISVDAFGIVVELGDGGVTNLLENPVVSGVLPCQITLEHCGL